MGWVALSQESVMLSQVTEVSLDGGNPDRVCLTNLLKAPHPRPLLPACGLLSKLTSAQCQGWVLGQLRLPEPNQLLSTGHHHLTLPGLSAL